MVASNFSWSYEQQLQDGTAVETNHRLLSHVWLHGIRNSDDLMELLDVKLPRLLQQNPTISLVAMDSIASLFRVNEDNNNIPMMKHDPKTDSQWKDRSVALFRISTRCKYLSTAYDVPFVIVNDVTTKTVPNHSSMISKVEPALGLSWSQCVNTSYFATRLKGNPIQSTRSEKQNDDSTGQAHPIKRVLRCLHSPTVQSGTTVEFQIDDRGAIPTS